MTLEGRETNASEAKLSDFFTLRSETRRALTALLALRVSFELQAPANAMLRFALVPHLPTRSTLGTDPVKGQAVTVPGLMNRLLALSVCLSPRFAVRRVMRYLNLGN